MTNHDRPYKYVCEECGGDDLSLEGFIIWNVYDQAFEVVDLCDKGHSCNDCGGECRIETRILTPEELEEEDFE